MLDAFQSAAKAVSINEVGVLVPLYDFYPSIESFLDTSVKKTIDQAETNPSLEPFDIQLLQVLFLIRYVDEMKGNVDNLVTLCLDQIDGDRLALRHRIEESLGRLEKETLISRSGDNYFFLTNEERDINKEIKQVDLSSGEEAKLQGEIIFEDVLKEQRKHRYSSQQDGLRLQPPLRSVPRSATRRKGPCWCRSSRRWPTTMRVFDKGKAILESAAEGGHVLIRLGNDESLGRELRTYLQTEKYLSRKNDGTLSESTKRILRDCAEDNRQRRERLTTLLGDMLAAAEYFVAGQPLKIKASTPIGAGRGDGISYPEHLQQDELPQAAHADPLKEIQAVLRSNDIAKENLLFQTGENNPEALEDVRSYLQLCSMKSQQVVLHDMLEKRYALRPYGWPDEEVLLLLARLIVLSEINLMMDSTLLPIDKVYEAITTPAKRRKIVVRKRETSDPKAIQNARSLGKDLFAEMGPDGEDGLCTYLQTKLKSWHSNTERLQAVGRHGELPRWGRNHARAGAHQPAPRRQGEQEIHRAVQHAEERLARSGRPVSRPGTFLRPPEADVGEAPQGTRRLPTQSAGTGDGHAQAGPALKRMQEILSAPSPYSSSRKPTP